MPVNSMSKENKMGVMPVKKLIFNMALPLIISMLIQALYNIVDSIFVSRISEDALTAVSLVFPIQNLMIAFATGTGVGMNALLSRRLGEKNREGAEEVANVGLLLSICTAAAFALFGIFGSHLYFSMQKGVSPIIAQYGAEYLSIVCIGSIGIFVEITAERMLQGTGQTLVTMYIQGVGAIINIILDPIMIFGLLGCPAMGVKGAAYATIIGQLVAAALGIILNQKHNSDVRVNLKKIRFNFPIIGEIYAIGFPSILMTAIGSVTTYLMNQILLAFSTTASAVYGVYFKLNSFFFMPLFGLNNAVVPIVAYNYGAQNRGQDSSGDPHRHDYRRYHYAAGLGCLLLPARATASSLRCLRGNDRHRYSGVPHYLVHLPACCCQYRCQQCVPGAGQKHLQYAGLTGSSAHCPHSGGISVLSYRCSR